MKKLTLILLLAIGPIVCCAQKVSLTSIKDKKLVTLLCSIDTVLFKRNDVFSVTLYQVSNQSGSAHMPETDEVSNKFLIAVANGDEVPEQHLYSAGDFYAPKVVEFYSLKNNNILLSIEYGIYKHRKKMNLNISLDKITLLK